MTEPERIYRHIQEFKPYLLYKNKKLKTFITVEAMMKAHPLLKDQFPQWRKRGLS
jgi:hypothetical protein